MYIGRVQRDTRRNIFRHYEDGDTRPEGVNIHLPESGIAQ
jgi:hypothetical protein